MKQKDMMYLLLAAGIFLVAGYLGYVNLMPQQRGPKTVTVETAGKIEDHLDKNTIAKLHDTSQAVDFNLPADFSGLGNNSPFGR